MGMPQKFFCWDLRSGCYGYAIALIVFFSLLLLFDIIYPLVTGIGFGYFSSGFGECFLHILGGVLILVAIKKDHKWIMLGGMIAEGLGLLISTYTVINLTVWIHVGFVVLFIIIGLMIYGYLCLVSLIMEMWQN